MDRTVKGSAMKPESVLKTMPRIVAEKQKGGFSLLAAYFLNDRNAEKAVWELEKNGLSRAAVLHRLSDGSVRVRDTFARLRLLLIVLLAGLLSAAAGLLYSLLSRSAANPGLSYPLWIPILAGAGLGAVFGGIGFRRSRYGIDRRVLAEHAQWLLAGESVLLLQAPLHTFRNPQIIIRESGETQPTIFLLFPPRKAELAEDPGATALLPQAQLQQFARKLAQEHRLLEKPARGEQLLRRVEKAADSLHRICLDLADAGRLEQPTTASAEWILDNEYIIESNARDIRANLPRRYFRQLPLLDRNPYLNLPRIYALAKELVAHVDLRLDRENLHSFLEAYQSVQPLAIGELWALPQMLRIALIEHIQYLADRTLNELRERETAGFWANRLISADRRAPGQLFSILAKLTENLPAPSEYFCSQLISYLYDEANALALVQNWLERVLPQPLSESDSPRTKPPNPGSDFRRERVHKPPPARPDGLEKDLRGGQQRRPPFGQRSGGHLPANGFRHPR